MYRPQTRHAAPIAAVLALVAPVVAVFALMATIVAFFASVATVVVGLAVFAAPVAAADPAAVTIHVFWQRGCPYCLAAKAGIETIVAERPGATVAAIEVGVDEADDVLFGRTLGHFALDRAAVPLVVIGEHRFLGFADDGRSVAAYRRAVEACLTGVCRDVVAALRRGETPPPPAAGVDDTAEDETAIPETVDLPLIGTVRTRDLSLPALTVVLAAVDGFNPCAMWVLVFLIGLLLGLEDQRRMWLLGATFLVATAAMYYAVMAAWLNLVLILGAAAWLRLAVAVLAIAAGGWFLWEFHADRDATCRVTDPASRTRIMTSFRRVVGEARLLPAMIGIAALAVMVNLVELICSAGVPVVYTQILATSDLPPLTHHAYLGLYLVVFMLDDVAVFATAMVALRVSGLTGAYARWSHLVGGLVLLGLGVVMIWRPEWLG